VQKRKDRQYRPRYRGPQTDQEKYSYTDRHHMQHACSERRSAPQFQNSVGHQADTGRQTEQKKTQSRRTTGEV